MKCVECHTPLDGPGLKTYGLPLWLCAACAKKREGQTVWCPDCEENVPATEAELHYVEWSPPPDDTDEEAFAKEPPTQCSYPWIASAPDNSPVPGYGCVQNIAEGGYSVLLEDAAPDYLYDWLQRFVDAFAWPDRPDAVQMCCAFIGRALHWLAEQHFLYRTADKRWHVVARGGCGPCSRYG